MPFAKLCHDWGISIKMKTKEIFTKFTWWAYKSSVKQVFGTDRQEPCLESYHLNEIKIDVTITLS